MAHSSSRTAHRTIIAVATLSLIAAACSSGGSTASSTAAPTTTSAGSTTVASATTAAPSTTTAATSTTAVAAACVPPTTTTPVKVHDVGNARDWDITSFDGTVIRAHWFPLAGASAATPAPTVLMGPGWGSAGDTNTSQVGMLGALSIKGLADQGYNVLTWDPRGFGASAGAAQIDSPEFEARDVQQLIDWVVTQPQVELDGTRDPRMGMVGASYGGGIQFVTAQRDCRIDAIVPIIAWHSLATSLFKANTPKLGWSTLLMLAAARGHLDPTITAAAKSAADNGTFPQQTADWFTARGPGDLVGKITVPTLIIQGTVDTLFTLDEAVTNYRLLQQAGTTVAMAWFCGGHGVCLTDQRNPTLVDSAALAWLARYVKHDTSAAKVPGFQFVDQHGTLYRTDAYPTADGTPVTGAGAGTLHLIATGGAGPSKAKSPNGDLVSVAALGITPAPADNAVSLKIAAPAGGALVVGAPQLHLEYTGTVPAGSRPSTVFAQLVDDRTGLVLGNQITPIAMTYDGAAHTVDVPLEMIAHDLAAGSSITLQLVATTVAYVQPRLGGDVRFSKVSISLPVVTTATKVG